MAKSTTSSPAKEAKRKSKAAADASPVSSKKAKKAAAADAVASTSASSAAAESSSKGKARAGEAMIKVEGSRKAFRDRSKAGAAFASFADYNPAPSTNFSLYRADALPDEAGYRTDDANDERLILAGETDTMAYVGSNFEFGSSVEARGYSGEYVVGVYDPTSSTVTLRAVPSFQVSRSVKANSSLSSISSNKAFADYQAMTQARRALGDTFGNRKQKNNARNQDKMKVDTSNMESILDDYTGGIETQLASLPSLEEITAMSTATRPMPPAHLDAKHPADAYRLSDLIAPSVFRTLPIQKFIDNANDMAEIRKLLPFSKQFPAWIASRIVENAQRASHLSGDGSGKKHTTFDDADDDDDEAGGRNDVDADGDATMMPALGATEDKEDAKNKVRIAYYISLLWFVHSKPKSVSQIKTLINDLRLDAEDTAKSLVHSITATFADTPANSTRATLSSFGQTKLLAYLCALALHLDNFAVDHARLAKDCNIPPTTLRELFRALGCTSATIAGEKRMVLKTPFTLPQPRKGKAPAKR
ncbi:hypothetical protein BCV70DRAFT_218806 [Testicularia cyperi]|uniref:RNA polymerase I associated factor, A49-like protein n=1 Tax=Testicularia cyperi TaxID=1882483 RepID=A0A317XKK6_9BASI|nr:hypothetical protein BCV70DRAFT_218806 [Testicularia cyperi]